MRRLHSLKIPTGTLGERKANVKPKLCVRQRTCSASCVRRITLSEIPLSPYCHVREFHADSGGSPAPVAPLRGFREGTPVLAGLRTGSHLSSSIGGNAVWRTIPATNAASTLSGRGMPFLLFGLKITVKVTASF